MKQIAHICLVYVGLEFNPNCPNEIEYYHKRLIWW